MRMTSQFASMTSLSNFFDVCMFLLSSLVTGPSFMSISCLVLAFFCKGLTRNPEIKIPPSEFCPISGGWDELGILNLARLSWVKCYWMLQNAKVAVFTVFSSTLYTGKFSSFKFFQTVSMKLIAYCFVLNFIKEKLIFHFYGKIISATFYSLKSAA